MFRTNSEVFFVFLFNEKNLHCTEFQNTPPGPVILTDIRRVNPVSTLGLLHHLTFDSYNHQLTVKSYRLSKNKRTSSKEWSMWKQYTGHYHSWKKNIYLVEHKTKSFHWWASKYLSALSSILRKNKEELKVVQT